MSKAEQQANKWNDQNKVGIDVLLTDDFGDIHETQTRSEAWTLGGHTAVVMVEGRSGGYLLERIKPKQ
jgi:hypothetical protein